MLKGYCCCEKVTEVEELEEYDCLSSSKASRSLDHARLATMNGPSQADCSLADYGMDLAQIAKLRTVADCEQLARNAGAERPDIAAAARKRLIELRAIEYGAESAAELDCLKALYAYEEVLRDRHGRRQPASYTRRMFKEHGVLKAVDLLVSKKKETAGYAALIEVGLHDYAFEAVVVRHPTLFSPIAVAQSTARMADWAAE